MSDPASPDAPLAYRLLTGTDDRSFCEKVSAALADGYVLYGSPSLTVNGNQVVAAQAVVQPHIASHAQLLSHTQESS